VGPLYVSRMEWAEILTLIADVLRVCHRDKHKFKLKILVKNVFFMHMRSRGAGIE
jgi:hypothetical protein